MSECSIRDSIDCVNRFKEIEGNIAKLYTAHGSFTSAQEEKNIRFDSGIELNTKLLDFLQTIVCTQGEMKKDISYIGDGITELKTSAKDKVSCDDFVKLQTEFDVLKNAPLKSMEAIKVGVTTGVIVSIASIIITLIVNNAF